MSLGSVRIPIEEYEFLKAVERAEELHFNKYLESAFKVDLQQIKIDDLEEQLSHSRESNSVAMWFIAVASVVLAVILLASPLFAQYEPAVMVRGKVCSQSSCSIAQGNGVIIGNNGNALLIVSAAHMFRDVSRPAVKIKDQWYPLVVAHSDSQADFAICYVQGSFEGIPVATVADEEPPIGADVMIDGYWPSPWRRLVAQRRFLRHGWLSGRVIQGVSGSGVSYQGELVGIVVGVTSPPLNETVIVPSTTIRNRAAQWGYRLPSCNGSRAQAIIASAPPVETPTQVPILNGATPGGAPPTSCVGCTERFEAINVHLGQCDANWSKQASINATFATQINGLSQRMDTLEGHDGPSEITALKGQIADIRADLEKLMPLTERRVILVTDGEITSQRTLKPSDPLVLGSEIVVKKATNAGSN